MSYSSSMDLLEETMKKFGEAYNELTTLGGPNKMMDNVIQTYIDAIYKNRIAMICNIPANVVDDRLVDYIQTGKPCDHMIEDGRFVNYRVNYTDTEVFEIVQSYFDKTDGMAYAPEEQEQTYTEAVADYNYAPQYTAPEPVQNNLEVLEDSEPEKAPVANIPQGEGAEVTMSAPVAAEPVALDVAQNSNISLGSIDNLPVADGINIPAAQEEVAPEEPAPTSIPDSELVVGDPVDNLDKMGMLDKRVNELLDKYSKSVPIADVDAAVMALYKTVLSELTGIPVAEIKDFVCKYAQAGIMETQVVDGQEAQVRRPLTDEEATLIAKHINNLSQEEVNALLNVGDTEPQLTMAA